jgi:hypothetical protein
MVVRGVTDKAGILMLKHLNPALAFFLGISHKKEVAAW